MTTPQGALTGVRVIDLTTILMGPMASRILADHGADVIRVDAPTASQDIVGGASGLSAIVLDTHRNKRSVVLDLKTDTGAAAMAELISSADVLVTNMRSAALDRLGLSAERLRAEHPALIHCVANGYGADGPYADRAAYDERDPGDQWSGRLADTHLGRTGLCTVGDRRQDMCAVCCASGDGRTAASP